MQPGLDLRERAGDDAERLANDAKQPGRLTQQLLERRLDEVLEEHPPGHPAHDLETRPERCRVVAREENPRDRIAEALERAVEPLLDFQTGRRPAVGRQAVVLEQRGFGSRVSHSLTAPNGHLS